MAQKRNGKSSRKARQKVLDQAAAPRPLADEVNRFLQKGTKRKKGPSDPYLQEPAAEEAREAELAEDAASGTLEPGLHSVFDPTAEAEADWGGVDEAEPTEAEAAPEPEADENASPPAWCAHWTRSLRLPPPPPLGGPPKCFVPPNLFGLRLLPTGTRHWGSASEVSLCAGSTRPKLKSADFCRDDSGEGTMCGCCVKLAVEGCGIPDAEDYVDGVVPPF